MDNTFDTQLRELPIGRALNAEYIGKHLVVELAESTPSIRSLKFAAEVTCKEQIRRLRSFLDDTKTDTPHIQYKRELMTQLLSILEAADNDSCIHYRLSVSPHWIYSVLTLKSNEQIIAAIRSPDVSKASPAEWAEYWGPEPALEPGYNSNGAA